MTDPPRKVTAVYELTDVTKTYRKNRGTVAAMQNVDLTIEDGEWLAVQGRTGHGKSTLLNILGALDRPTSGRVLLDGQDLSTMRDRELVRVRAATIGFVFQAFNLIPTLSAAENVEAGLIPLALDRDERQQRAQQALENVGLGDRAGHLPSELSGGQQQRVGIARALAKRPQVLLADEPTGNLDDDTRDEIVELLEDIRRQFVLTLVFVTHDTELAQRAPRVAVMRDGRLSVGDN
jgi:putative ABC transport system ATP-binding protein